MTTILGIDPGKKGALAFFNLDTRNLMIHDMPTVPKATGKGEDTNYPLLGELLRPPPGEDYHAIVENVWSMPREGVSSAHAFGRNNGAIFMALAIHNIPYHRVTPTTWKRYFGLSKDKGASRGLATERFPHQAMNFSRVKDDGRAEAALLALYGVEHLITQKPE